MKEIKNAEELADEVIERIRDYLPEEYQDVKLEKVIASKVQGQSYKGIVFKLNGCNGGPTLNVDLVFEAYKNGMSIVDILKKAADSMAEAMDNMPKAYFAINYYDYSVAKGMLFPCMIGTKGNEKVLQEIPHTYWQNLAVIYRLMIDESSSAVITNGVLENYGVSVEQLHKDAVANASLKYPLRIATMVSMLTELSGTEFPDDDGKKIYVATCNGGYLGASVVLNPAFAEEAEWRAGKDFYLLPASIHEMLIVPSDKNDPDELLNMVTEINASEVSESDFLSDSVYQYSSAAGEYTVITNDETHVDD